MSDIRYVRNMRPNMVIIKLYAGTPNQVKYKLGRRGDRADSIGVPSEAFSDHGFLRNLRLEYVEEISYETFMALGARIDDWPQAELVERTPHGVQSAFDPEVRLAQGLEIKVPDSTEVFWDPISVEKFDKELMKPRLEFKEVTDSEEDAVRALQEAGLAEKRKIASKTAPKRPPVGDPLKYDQVSRQNSPRKGMIKGVVGGENAQVMEDGE